MRRPHNMLRDFLKAGLGQVGGYRMAGEQKGYPRGYRKSLARDSNIVTAFAIANMTKMGKRSLIITTFVLCYCRKNPCKHLCVNMTKMGKRSLIITTFVLCYCRKSPCKHLCVIRTYRCWRLQDEKITPDTFMSLSH